MADAARHIRPIRIVLMSVLLTGVTGLLLLMAAGAPPSPIGSGLALLAGVVLMPLMASPIEWLVHRYIYHRPLLPFLRPIYDIHHRVHHHVFFPTWRYVTSGPPRRIPIFGRDHDHAHEGPLANGLVHLAHFTFYLLLAAGTIWVPAWMLTRSVPLLLGVILASLVVSDLMVSVHDTIHRPGVHPLIERWAWFRFLDQHHYIHHVDTEANVNFLLPLADWLYGTMRRTMTEAELARHGTLEHAKTRPVGHGESAREAARRTQAA